MIEGNVPRDEIRIQPRYLLCIVQRSLHACQLRSIRDAVGLGDALATSFLAIVRLIIRAGARFTFLTTNNESATPA